MSETERMIPTRMGTQIPASRIRGEMVLAHDTAVDLVDRAIAMREYVRSGKHAFFGDVDAYIDLVLERYNARLGGRRGGVGIVSFDETRKVEVSTADYSRLNGAILAAQALVNEIMDDLTAGADQDLRALVTAAFQRDERTGRISVQRISALTQIQLRHARWPDAVAAIRDAIEPAGSRRYIRFYQRANSEAAWEQIDVNFSSL